MLEPKSHRVYITFAVSFHITTALAVTICNKAVLNVLAAPVTLLFSQAALSIVFIHIGSIFNVCSVPRLNTDLVQRLMPLLAMRVIAQLSKTYCLLNVNASFYQIARGLLLPFTILLSLVYLPEPRPSFLILLACFITMVGFCSGVSGEAVGQTSTIGIVWGIWSSLTTAIETVVIKKSVSLPKVGILDLVYVTAVVTGPAFAVIAIFNGEYLEQTSLGITHPLVFDFAKKALFAGILNFLLSVAAYLQIKATSPTTHMISTAARGVLQSLLAVVLIRNEHFIRSRIVSISIILTGSILYTFAKEMEARKNSDKTVLPLHDIPATEMEYSVILNDTTVNEAR